MRVLLVVAFLLLFGAFLWGVPRVVAPQQVTQTPVCDCACPPNTICATFTPRFLPTATFMPTASPIIFPTNTMRPSPTRTTVPLITLTPSPFPLPPTPTQELGNPPPATPAIDNFTCWQVIAPAGVNVRNVPYGALPDTLSPIAYVLPARTFYSAYTPPLSGQLLLYNVIYYGGYQWAYLGRTTTGDQYTAVAACNVNGQCFSSLAIRSDRSFCRR